MLLKVISHSYYSNGTNPYWILQRDDKKAYTNIMADVCDTDMSCVKNYSLERLQNSLRCPWKGWLKDSRKPTGGIL